MSAELKILGADIGFRLNPLQDAARSVNGEQCQTYGLSQPPSDWLIMGGRMCG